MCGFCDGGSGHIGGAINQVEGASVIEGGAHITIGKEDNICDIAFRGCVAIQKATEAQLGCDAHGVNGKGVHNAVLPFTSEGLKVLDMFC